MQKTDYSSQIFSALNHAAPMKKIDGTWKLITPKKFDDYLNFIHRDMADMAELPDHYPIFIDIDPSRLPYCVVAHNPEELRTILDQYLKINKERLPVKDRILEIQHEAEHGDAAKLMGAKDSKYALELFKSKNGEKLGWQLVHYPRKLTTTKLGLAVLSVYPSEPSEGDIAQIKSLGYQDVKEVALLAAQYGLPKPLSF